jgi:hypothetical protein
MQENSLVDLVDTLVEMKDSEKKAARLRNIVPIEEWINSEYYCGPDALSIYPYWKDHITKIFNSPVMINEVILTGGLGTGKTTIANIILLRRIYELSCYSNIPALFNLMASSKIMMAYFNINLGQALLTGYGQLKEMIDNCPYFQEYFKRNLRKDNEIVWPQSNMMVRFASGTQHTIGTNLIGSVLDEANFFSKTEKITEAALQVQDKAKEIYTAARNRRKITFLSKWRKPLTKYISFFYYI